MGWKAPKLTPEQWAAADRAVKADHERDRQQRIKELRQARDKELRELKSDPKAAAELRKAYAQAEKQPGYPWPRLRRR